MNSPRRAGLNGEGGAEARYVIMTEMSEVAELHFLNRKTYSCYT